MQLLDQIKIVLLETSHPGNIGAVARAMKTMGLSQLCLVKPRKFPSVEATALSSGAHDVLKNAQVVDTFEEAVESVQLVVGTSHRLHQLHWLEGTPREAVGLIKDKQCTTAIVFGTERVGMDNDELALCQYHIKIPTNPKFTSLNLAQAVQVVAYECFQQLADLPAARTKPELATQEELEGFYQHLDEVMVKTQFLNPEQPKLLRQRIRALYARAGLTTTEIHILRGQLAAILRMLTFP